MRFVLRFLVLLLGLVSTATALSIMIVGPLAVFAWVSVKLGLDVMGLEAFSQPFVDGTLRFAAFFYLVFGLVTMNVARDYRDNRQLIPVLMIILIIAGFARLWSIYSLGDAGTLSLIAALTEILPATLILMLYFMTRGQDRY